MAAPTLYVPLTHGFPFDNLQLHLLNVYPVLVYVFDGAVHVALYVQLAGDVGPLPVPPPFAYTTLNWIGEHDAVQLAPSHEADGVIYPVEQVAVAVHVLLLVELVSHVATPSPF